MYTSNKDTIITEDISMSGKVGSKRLLSQSAYLDNLPGLQRQFESPL